MPTPADFDAARALAAIFYAPDCADHPEEHHAFMAEWDAVKAARLREKTSLDEEVEMTPRHARGAQRVHRNWRSVEPRRP